MMLTERERQEQELRAAVRDLGGALRALKLISPDTIHYVVRERAQKALVRYSKLIDDCQQEGE